MVKLVVDASKQNKIEKKPRKSPAKSSDFEESQENLPENIDDLLGELKTATKPRKKKEIVTLEYTDFITNEAELWSRLQPKKGELRNWLTKNQPKQLECKREGVLSQLVLVFNELMTTKVDEFRKKNT
jgi:hypothetical protein